MADNEVNASLDEEDIIEEESGGGLDAKKMILLVVLPLLLIGGGGAAYLTGMLDSYIGKDAAAEVEDYDVEQEAANLNAAFLKIPDMIVNLSNPDDSQPRYLRLSVQLELEDEEAKLAVENVLPRVIDQFQTYLRELRVTDLRGSAGIYRLQMELLSRVNAAAYPVEVQDVLFQEILIQ